MPLDRLGPRAFGLSCDRCRCAAPTMILGAIAEEEVRFEGTLDAIESARQRGFELTYRIESGHKVIVTRCLCRACARLYVN